MFRGLFSLQTTVSGGTPPWRRPAGTAARRSTRAGASSSSSPAGSASAKAATEGLLKSALTCGTLSMAGDLLAQGLGHYLQPSTKPATIDAARAARMAGFGTLFYGPYQHFWYRALDAYFPGRSTGAFLSKVTLNQVALAPVVLAAVFTWNLALTGRSAAAIGDKIKGDLWPTMVNGWKFWVPAASINFYAVPLQHQVLYMSACGLLWSAYLSHASVTSGGGLQAAPAGAGGKGQKK